MALSRLAYRRPIRLRHHTIILSLGRLSCLATRTGLWSQRLARSTPRAFPATGFDSIGQDQLIEEESLPEYCVNHFYPVRLGEVFDGRFQTVAKLGYSSSSTIWLARDLQDHQYVALKIYIHNSAQLREFSFYQ
ncbi:hypothetical protein LIA77_01929 [Sarocladium implicatum]|nr:hypothetical protein LIA77_01929 [Sarocladium implicatum]